MNDEVLNTLKHGGYLVCSHCSSKRLIIEKQTDDLRECMSHRRYKRNKRGAIVQVE